MEAWPSRATLRRYSEVTRKYGKLLNELESVLCKGKNLLADINRLERLAMNMKALKGEEGTGTNAEACAYLMTASLTQPIDSDWMQIYLYVANQTYHRWGKAEMPPDIAVEGLSDYHMGELRRLKECLILKKARGQPNAPSWECCCPRYDPIVSGIISLVKRFARFIDIL